MRVDDEPDPSERYSDVLFAHRAEGERERLTLLAEALDAQLVRRIEALAPGPEGRFLELGAGLGTMAGWLARRYRSAQVVATDVSTSFLDELDEPNLTALRHDLTVDDFPDGSFAFIHTRWVLCNLPSRDADLRRIVRWLAPGGTLLVEEGGSYLEEARNATFRTTSMACLDAAMRRLGVDGHWACRFPAQLVELGLRDCGCDGNGPTWFHGGEPWALFWRESFGRTLPDALVAGGVTADEAAEGLAALVDPDFRDVGISTVAAWGRAPG